MNNWNGVGRITKDIELKFLPGGTAVTKFTIAIDRKGKKDAVDYIPITVFGKSAENVANYMSKGRMIGINGRLQIDNVKNEKGWNTYVAVVADEVQFLDKASPSNIGSNDNEYEGMQPVDDGDIPF